MGKFWNFPNSLWLKLVIGYFLFIATSQAEIKLDKLTACNEIAEMNRLMRLESWPATNTCDKPKSALDKEIYKRIGGQESGICFLQQPPTNFLDGFTCIRHPVKVGASFVCYRAANAQEIVNFKKGFKEQGADRANEYKIASSKCSVTNGNTTIVLPSSLDTALRLVAKTEFGFISFLGQERPADSSVEHSYAHIDPSLGSAVPSAIEFISFNIKTPPYVPTPTIKRMAGKWETILSENKEYSRELNDLFRKNRAQLYVKQQDYGIRRFDVSYDSTRKINILKSLQASMVNTLLDESFQELSGAEIKSKTGKDMNEIAKEMLNKIPYGNRKSSMEEVAKSSRIFFNLKRPDCTENDAGAFAIYMFNTPPIPEVDSDFGNVMFLGIGFGACSRIAKASTATYFDGIFDLIWTKLASELKKQ